MKTLQIAQLRDGVKGSMRRSVPWTAVPFLVDFRSRRCVRNESALCEARQGMKFLLGAAASDSRIEDLAYEHVAYNCWRAEARWHTSQITNQEVIFPDIVLDLAKSKRGVVFNFMHHGQFDGSFASMRRAGFDLHVACLSAMFDERAPWTLKQHMRVVREGGVPINVLEGSAGMISRLQSGQNLCIASDVPGSTAVRFLGRDLKGSLGAARIARSTASPVVIVTAKKVGRWQQRLELSEPLEPADFQSDSELLQRMLDIHEAAILAWPEAVEAPLKRWKSTDAGKE